jgi:hypothetical protein
VQSIFASIEAVCRKKLQDVNRDSGANFRKKLYVSQNQWAGFARSALSGGS